VSADNFLLMREFEGQYVVTTEFASSDDFSLITRDSGVWFDSYDEALDFTIFSTDEEYGPVVLCNRKDSDV